MLVARALSRSSCHGPLCSWSAVSPGTSLRAAIPGAGIRAAPRSKWHAQRRGAVQITPQRLEEFVRAELNLFARRTSSLRHIKMQELLRISSSPTKVARFIDEELPVRFARRVKHIQRIEGWERIPELVDIVEMHSKSFRDLRLADPSDTTEYLEVILRIRKRHKNIGHLFAKALTSIDKVRMIHTLPPDQQELSLEKPQEPLPAGSRESVEQWSNWFFRSRVSAEIMMAHYVECHRMSETDESDPSKVGIIDTKCNPFNICQQAAELIQSGDWPCKIEIESPETNIEFCHAPRYLFYIVSELLRNSAEATVRETSRAAQGGAGRADVESKPIQLAICADDDQVVIRVRDRGGGFKKGTWRSGENIWSFTSAIRSEEASEAQDVFGDGSSAWDGSSVTDPHDSLEPAGAQEWSAGQSPISGRGLGFPLSRLYATYFGGTLEIINMPGLGVDAFLLLKRLEST